MVWLRASSRLSHHYRQARYRGTFVALRIPIRQGFSLVPYEVGNAARPGILSSLLFHCLNCSGTWISFASWGAINFVVRWRSCWENESDWSFNVGRQVCAIIYRSASECVKCDSPAKTRPT